MDNGTLLVVDGACKFFWEMHFLKGGSCLLLHRKRAGSRHTQWWSGQAVAISDDVLLYLLYYDVIHKCSHNNTVGVIRNLTTCPWVADFNFDYPIGNIKI